MSSWKLKAGAGTEEEIGDGKLLYSDVKDGEKALTVARNGNDQVRHRRIEAFDFTNTKAITNIVNNINGGNTAITNINANFSISGAANANKQTITLKRTRRRIFNSSARRM